MSTEVDATRVARLTAAGRSAVATVVVHGPRAVSLIERFFHPRSGRSLPQIPLRQIAVGDWVDPAGRREELVVAKLAPDHVEIHSHGGLAASDAILSALLDAGAIAEPHPASRSLLGPAASPSRQLAWQALPDATTERVAAVLLDQFRGAFEDACRRLAQQCSLHSPEGRTAAQRTLARLIELGPVGGHLTSPWQVVLAGAPNVGKSSLANALLGYERSIVWDQPGTTRDVVSANTALDGWPVEVSDTAGIHASTAQLESAGIERATRQIESADLVVFVVDAREPNHASTDAWRARARRSLLVANKCDLLPPGTRFPAHVLPTSVREQIGLRELQRAIIRQLVPVPPQPGEAVPLTSHQLDLLRQAAARLAEIPPEQAALESLTQFDQFLDETLRQATMTTTGRATEAPSASGNHAWR